MGYARPCLIQPALSGLAREVSQLPVSQYAAAHPEAIFSHIYPWSRVRYNAVPDQESGFASCLPTHTNYSLANIIKIYLRSIDYFSTVAGGSSANYEFTRNWYPEIGSLGTQVGQLEYNGKGIWEGWIEHPETTGPLYLQVMTRNCQANVFTGRFGPNPEEMPLRMLELPQLHWSENDQWGNSFMLGEVWHEENDFAGQQIKDTCPLTFAPWYYSGMPTSYTIEGGDWNETIVAADFGFFPSDPPCTHTDGRPINWLLRTGDPVGWKSLIPQQWRWTQHTNSCRVLDPGEKGWLSAVTSTPFGPVLQAGWGTQSGGYVFPIQPGGSEGGAANYIVAPLFTSALEPEPIPGGGRDWLTETTLVRLFDSTGWDQLAPDEMIMTPVI